MVRRKRKSRPVRKAKQNWNSRPGGSTFTAVRFPSDNPTIKSKLISSDYPLAARNATHLRSANYSYIFRSDHARSTRIYHFSRSFIYTTVQYSLNSELNTKSSEFSTLNRELKAQNSKLRIENSTNFVLRTQNFSEHFSVQNSAIIYIYIFKNSELRILNAELRTENSELSFTSELN